VPATGNKVTSRRGELTSLRRFALGSVHCRGTFSSGILVVILSAAEGSVSGRQTKKAVKQPVGLDDGE
jgi:hypothetical protein